MNKRITIKTTLLFVFYIAVVASLANAQTDKSIKKVAILETVDKDGSVPYAVKLMLRSNLAKAIARTPGYEAYDRTDMDAIMGEQNFQRTGLVSDDQIKRLGEMTGAAYILVAEAVKVDETDMFITAKILNVETAKTEMTDNVLMSSTPADIQHGCESLANKLLGTSQNMPLPVQQGKTTPVQEKIVSTTLDNTNTTPLTTLADGTAVYASPYDESERMSYNEALNACSCKGDGWRLPTIEELKLLEKNKDIYHNLSTAHRYWALEGGYTIDMSTGYKVKTKDSVKAKVRCVRESR